MGAQRLDVHVVAIEADFDTALLGLQHRFGLPASAAERFLRGLPRVARYQADVEEANAYKRVLSELGVQVVLRPSGSRAPQTDVPSLPVPAHGPTGITHSMRSFASSARLANRVPRAPALPEDLTRPMGRGRPSRQPARALDPDSPWAEWDDAASDMQMEFRGLSSPNSLDGSLSLLDSAEAAAHSGATTLHSVKAVRGEPGPGAAAGADGRPEAAQETRGDEQAGTTGQPPARWLLWGGVLLVTSAILWVALG